MTENEVECCGKTRTSRFCPDCGKKIQSRTLYGLLRHLETHAQSQRKRADGAGAKHTLSQWSPERRQRYIDRLECAALKWESWRDLLRAALTEQEKHDA